MIDYVYEAPLIEVDDHPSRCLVATVGFLSGLIAGATVALYAIAYILAT